MNEIKKVFKKLKWEKLVTAIIAIVLGIVFVANPGGSDAAVEAADVVLLNDDFSRLPRLLRVAKRTCRIARQNIVFALAVKAVCMVLGALGILTGPLTASSAGITAAVLCGLIASFVARPKEK